MDKLKTYLINRDKAITTLLNKPRRTFTFDDFHDLRVEIKKLDALFELLNSCIPEFKRKKTFAPFDSIFQQAGKVRELQLEQTVLKKYFLKEVPPDLTRTIKSQLSKEKKEYFSLIRALGTSSLHNINRKITLVLGHITKAKYTRYLRDKRKNIITLLDQDEIEPEQIHPLRKQLKSFTYNLKSLGIAVPHKSIPLDDSLMEWLGQWHDGQEIIRHLQHARKEGGLSTEEKNQLSKIITRISSANQRLYKKIQVTLAKRDSPRS